MILQYRFLTSQFYISLNKKAKGFKFQQLQFGMHWNQFTAVAVVQFSFNLADESLQIFLTVVNFHF